MMTLALTMVMIFQQFVEDDDDYDDDDDADDVFWLKSRFCRVAARCPRLCCASHGDLGGCAFVSAVAAAACL